MKANRNNRMFKRNLTAICVATLFSGMPLLNAYASDLAVYKANTPGVVTLMFLFDTSGSMASLDGFSTSKLARLQTAVSQVLSCNATGTICNLPDSLVIGLAHFSYKGNSVNSVIDVPARRLDAIVSGSGGTAVNQRATIVTAANAFTATGSTPTSHGIADVASYLMGTSTASPLNTKFGSSYSSGIANADSKVTNPTIVTGSGSTLKYTIPVSISDEASQPVAQQVCNGQGIFILSDGEPNQNFDAEGTSNLMGNALNLTTPFQCAVNPGIIENDTGSLSATTTGGGQSGWNCLGTFVKAIKSTTNPSGVSIRTAFAGLGSDFGSAKPISVTIAGNAYTYYNCAKLPILDAKNSCQLTEKSTIYDPSGSSFNTGEGGFGNGGFFLVNTSADIVKGINSFVATLSPVIPAVNTGSPSIPSDTLNIYRQEPYAYYSQFQPDLNHLQGVWLGNVKKYKVANNSYYAKSGGSVTNTDGTINTNTFDYWNPNASADGGNALAGGALSQLPVQLLPTYRTIYSNRSFKAATTGVTAAVAQEVTLAGSLVAIPAAAGSATTAGTAAYFAASQDPDRGYLLNLLGYSIPDPIPSPTSPVTLPPTTKAFAISSPIPPTLRQMGATLHSQPVLLTTSGTVVTKATGTYNVGDYNPRKDYVMYGTTQGLLEVIDASTGIEKFAFAPYEMIANQENGFLPFTSQSAANQLYAGIDGPWTSYAVYQPTGTNQVTASTLNVYGGLRMGGSSYYGLNFADSTFSGGKYTGFTNIETRAPKFLFKIDPVNGVDGVGTALPAPPAGLKSFMGQSWSRPTVTKINWNGVQKLVMIVGGGYDTCFEYPNFRLGAVNSIDTGASASCNNLTYTQGAGVYIFDATTGGLLWWTGNSQATGTTTTANNNLKYSVVSSIKAVDRDGDGLTDALYFGDLGGQVWRIDIDNTQKTTNKEFVRVQRIADFSQPNIVSPRFYESPSWVVQNDPNFYLKSGVKYPYFATVSMTSGDRSSPSNVFTTGAVNDGVYTIFDRDIGSTSLYTSGYTPLTASTTTAAMLDITQASATLSNMESASNKGWYHLWSSSIAARSTVSTATGSIARYKGFGTTAVIANNLFASIYDAQGVGTVTASSCGAGVAGNSYQRNYCLPYGLFGTDGDSGYCGTGATKTPITALTNEGVALGSGIITVAVGGTDNSTGSTTESSGKAQSTAFGIINSNPAIPNTSCSGSGCAKNTNPNPGTGSSTGTKTGQGTGTYAANNGLQITLKRWYEKQPNKNAQAVQ